MTTLTEKQPAMVRRKHVSQMNLREKNGLWMRLRNIPVESWHLSAHTLDRLEEKEIHATMEDFLSTIFYAELIEYKLEFHKGRYHEKVVLRGKAVVNGNHNMHVVYGLTNSKIVTAWINHVDDRHETLDMSIYDENTRVFGV